MMTRILIFTGDGKGKTSAALGNVLRAAGHGMRSLIIQFVKQDKATGELAACRFLPRVEIVQKGRGFVPGRNAPEFAEHREAALEALELAERAVGSSTLDLLVLDEICVALAKGLIEEERVLELLHMETKLSCIILTGRGASSLLIEQADTVTEMRCVRHGMQQGIGAQEGVEY